MTRSTSTVSSGRSTMVSSSAPGGVSLVLVMARSFPGGSADKRRRRPAPIGVLDRDGRLGLPRCDLERLDEGEERGGKRRGLGAAPDVRPVDLLAQRAGDLEHRPKV